jgi:hypothetical protein
MSNYETNFGRNRQDKSFEGNTTIPLGFDRRELRISTYKHPFDGGLQTVARVVQVSEDGRSYSHAFGLAGGGDFNVKLKRDKGLRCTEKNVRAMHAEALSLADATLASALMHYGEDMA